MKEFPEMGKFRTSLDRLIQKMMFWCSWYDWHSSW